MPTSGRSERRQGRRRLLAPTIHTVAAAGLVIAFLAWAPRSHWDHSTLLLALAALTIVAYSGEVVLKTSAPAYFDATFGLVLLGLVLGGPLPALLIWIIPDLADRVVARRHRLFSVAFLGNVVSYGGGILAGCAVLMLVAAPDYLHQAPVLIPAGLALIVVNFVFARFVTAVFWQGFPAGVIAREFHRDIPAHLGTLLLVALTTGLLPTFGVFSLLLVAPLVAIPQLAAMLTRPRPVSELDATEASVVYVAAIADVLGLSRGHRRVLRGAARVASTGRPPAGSLWGDLHAMYFTAFYAAERYDGSGKPAGLAGRAIPLDSRILAVAQRWSALTAHGTAELSHTEALLALELEAYRQLDPNLVAAAAEVVASERIFAPDEPAFEPRLHALPLSRRPRQRALARVVGAI